jgi:hypothetical protein
MLDSVTCLAEFSRGTGNIEEPTRKASALFNQGLSSFHLMLSAWDSRNPDEAVKRKADAVKFFNDASNSYTEAVKVADHHILNPNPQTDQEKDDVSYFYKNASRYGLKEPIAQDDVLKAVAKSGQALSEKIKSRDVGKSLNDLRAQQALANEAAELSQFLVSVTTVLTLG